MSITFKYAFIAAATLALAACGTSHSGHDDHEDHDGHVHEEDLADEHGHEGEEHPGEIKLEPEDATRLGVTTTKTEFVDFVASEKVAGEITLPASAESVVSAPAAGRVRLSSAAVEGRSVSSGQTLASITVDGTAAGASATVALEAARCELERIEPLRQSGIATVAEYNAARAAYEEALIAAGRSSSATSATAPRAGVVTAVLVSDGSHVEAGTPIATVATTTANTAATLRADVPLSTTVAPGTKALVKVDGCPTPLSATATSSPAQATGGYRSVYFNIDGNCQAPAGAFAEVSILNGSAVRALTVPLTAVSEHLGQKFIYVRLDEDCYERRPVKLGNDNGVDIVVTDGLVEGDEVVTEGVTFMRLAEASKAAVPGHTHNH